MTQSNQSKTKNEKMQAMRNRIKTTAPLIIPTSKFNSQQLTSPCTPLLLQTCQSPNSNSPPSASFSVIGIDSSYFLKNAFQQKYQLLEKLGEGANGVVRKCKNKQTNQMYAVKIGKMEEEHMVSLHAIVNAMKRLKHKSILTLRELYTDSKRCKYYHVIEYLPYPSLKQLITQGYEFTPSIIKKIMKQLLSALQYFHKHYIVHRDIKTSNILYDVENERLFVIDLGIITKTIRRGKRRNLWSNNGTLEYKAPEMLMGSSYNESVDNWAAGVVLFELVESRTPFKEESHFDIIDNITELKYSFNMDLWKDIPLAKQLVIMLLKPKNQRLSAKQALQAPWFIEIDWQQMTIRNQSPETKILSSSITFNKNKLLSGSMMIGAKNNQMSDEEEGENLTLTVFNPSNLRKTHYEKERQNTKPINIEELLGISQDEMIINNS